MAAVPFIVLAGAPSIAKRALRVVPLAWVLLLAALGARGVIRDDARYAWAMFPYVLTYTLDYRWRLDDGNVVPYTPGHEIRHALSEYAPGSTHEAWYGIGALRTDIDAYVRVVSGERVRSAQPPHAIAFEAELRWKKHADGEEHVEVRTP